MEVLDQHHLTHQLVSVSNSGWADDSLRQADAGHAAQHADGATSFVIPLRELVPGGHHRACPDAIDLSTRTDRDGLEDFEQHEAAR